MTINLAEAWAKYYWAKTHLQRIDGELWVWSKRYTGTMPFGIKREIRGDDGCVVFRVSRVDRTAASWPLIIGDALVNFMATLDYLAWQLVGAGHKPNPDRPNNVGFPIYTNKNSLNGAMGQKLPGVVYKRYCAIILRHQPYRGSPPENHPLAILKSLGGRDKHRQLQLVLLRHTEFSAELKTCVGIENPSLIGPISNTLLVQPDAELVRVYGKFTQAEPKVEVRFKGSTGVAFEDGRWVMPALESIATEIKAILEEFEAVIAEDAARPHAPQPPIARPVPPSTG